MVLCIPSVLLSLHVSVLSSSDLLFSCGDTCCCYVSSCTARWWDRGIHNFVEVPPPGGKAKYLGQTITFAQRETVEREESRVRNTWASFAAHRQELTSKSYQLQHRLQLFNAVITPSMSYGTGTWTLTTEHEKMIRSNQRKKLRLNIQTERTYKITKKAAGTEEN